MKKLFTPLPHICMLLLIAGNLNVMASTLSQDTDDETDPTPMSDTMTRFVESYGDAERGEELFNTFQEEVGFACSTCHYTDSQERLIGPGLLNIGQRGAERIEGRSAALYIYMTIIRPGFYTVEDFPDDLMPREFDPIFSERELYDIIAYLLTLEGDPEPVDEAADLDRASDTTVDLPDPESIGDPEHGEILFNTFQADAGFMCATCHHVDTEDRLVGPGLLNVATRAETRVEGQNALDYLFESIVDPDAYVVEGFPAELMPDNWGEIYSEDEIYDIVAYLLTLHDE